MKKRVFVVSALAAVLGIGSLSLFVLTKNPGRIISQTGGYVLTLNASNGTFLPTSKGSGRSSGTSPRTQNGNRIIFTYENAMRYSDGFATLGSSTGNIGNLTALTGIFSVKVEYLTGSCSLSLGNTYQNYGSTFEIQTGLRYEIDDASFFRLNSMGSVDANVKSITVEYSCGEASSLEPVKDHDHHGYHYLPKAPTAQAAGNLEFWACEECQYVSLSDDGGDYVDAVLTYELPSTHIAYLPPIGGLRNDLMRKPTQIPYPIPINAEVSSTSYPMDKTGVSDATPSIQSALNYVGNLGGGTVYVPAGRYRLLGQLVIPTRVTLVGDFKGPSADDYGTVFLCEMPYSSSLGVPGNAQIFLNSNAGINGVTFYYPNQSVTNVVEYGYTLATAYNGAVNFANLFFLNSYRGIAINNPTEGVGELTNIENVYGTFLNEGISAYYLSDAGYWDDIHISPSYYENAISAYRCPNAATLRSYVRENLVAFTLGDLDDYFFSDIDVDNAKIGLHFSKDAGRSGQAFWGLLDNVNLTDCVTGVYAKKIYDQGAALFTHSRLGTIVNVSEYGLIKMAKCDYEQILGDGKTVVEYGSETYEASPSHDDSNNYQINDYLYYIDNLDNTGATDVSSALQAKLDSIESGGLAVLPNGVYRLDNPITVPSHTMLTSFGLSFTRSLAEETATSLVKFISLNNDCCVKLGEYAGINGIRIANPSLDPETAKSRLTSSGTTTFISVKGVGVHSFAINTEAAFTFTGFDFSGVSGHYLKYCYGSAYQTFIKAGQSGKIVASLSNLNFLSRHNLANLTSANAALVQKWSSFEGNASKLDYVRDLTRTYSTMIEVSDSSDELVFNCFSYGLKRLIHSANSNLLALNTSIDNLKAANYAYVIDGGDATIASTFRVFGEAIKRNSGHVTAYGRFDFGNKKEANYDSNTHSTDQVAPLPSGLTAVTLSTCESISGVSGATRNSSYKHGGSYSWRASSNTNPAIAYTFSARNISSYEYLRFYLYCSNISRKGESAYVELTSSGTCDSQEINFRIDSQIKQTGWNEIVIDFSEKQRGSTDDFNPNACNYFRFHLLNSSCNYYVDDIDFLYAPSSQNSYTISECENATTMNGAALSDFSCYGSGSWKAHDSVNATFALPFSAINISSHMSDGYLTFLFYCPNVSKLGSTVCVELTSAGTWDQQEINKEIRNLITRDGWNEVRIPLSSMIAGSADAFNPSACNFFRVYTLGSGCYFHLDHVQIVS